MSEIQIYNGNEKLDNMLSQVNASQNSRLKISNTYSGLQSFVSILTERFDNTQKDQSNYYLRE